MKIPRPLTLNMPYNEGKKGTLNIGFLVESMDIPFYEYYNGCTIKCTHHITFEKDGTPIMTCPREKCKRKNSATGLLNWPANRKGYSGMIGDVGDIENSMTGLLNWPVNRKGYSGLIGNIEM